MDFYLDNAASTKPTKEVIEEINSYLKDYWYNPSSLYLKSVNVKNNIEHAKNIIAKTINAEPSSIYFTSGGSESNCWAIQGFINNRLSNMRVPCIITTKVEHKSIIECVNAQTLCHKYFLDVDDSGFIYIDELKDAIDLMITVGVEPKDILVSIQFANNEIGTIQDVMEIGNICHMYGCVFHTDAVQAFCHTYIDVDIMGIDMLSASSHKIGGCKGTGFLYIKNGIELNPLIYGSQMNGMRGGTENVPGIMGMAKAVENINIDDNIGLCLIREYFIDKLEDIGCVLNGSRQERLPNNINVILPYDINGENLLYNLDTSNIMIGTGSSCNSRSVEPSYVLKAIGLNDNEASRSIRITISNDITIDDVDEIIKQIQNSIILEKSIN